MNFIDLFAGAGGLSEGFLKQGFNPLAHVEMDNYACQTLKTRTAYWELKNSNRYEVYRSYLQGDISQEELYAYIPEELNNLVINSEISEMTVKGIFKIIDKNMKLMGEKKVDLIIGGPPCQAYSLVGRARDPHGKELDPRNYLYKQYLKFLKKYKPKMFVFENVPGLLSAGNRIYLKSILDETHSLGYKVEYKILDASKYGVLQQRKRVILIGLRGRSFSFPEIETVSNEYSVSELLDDLPPLNPGDSLKICNYTSPESKYLLDSGIRDDDFVTQHITRMHNETDREIYRRVIKTWEESGERLKYTDLPESLRTHKNLNSFLDRFKVVAANAPYCHTMVAHIAKDGHYYIHPDINQLRSLSVREAARIQSFPDNFYFEGPRTAVFTQIGNAVPPILSEKIAKIIRELLESNRKRLKNSNNSDNDRIPYLSRI
jgi:DNA (cytosine-5)-methyltransferase 1